MIRLFFLEWIALSLFCSQKTSDRSKKFVVFTMFLTVLHCLSPFLCLRGIQSLFRSQKAICTKNQRANYQPCTLSPYFLLTLFQFHCWVGSEIGKGLKGRSEVLYEKGSQRKRKKDKSQKRIGEKSQWKGILYRK